MAINEEFLTQGSVNELLKMTGLDVDNIVKTCIAHYNQFMGTEL